jgi:hypothetical protein
MPLNTAIYRNGKPLSLRWGGFHMVAMTLAAAIDSQEGELIRILKDNEGGRELLSYDPIPLSPGDVWSLTGYHIVAATPLNTGDYTLKGSYRFTDPTDDELLELLPGDVLSMSRD